MRRRTHWFDQTGLYFYNARYYDAEIGRFISPDTIVPYPADPQSFNRYSYCRNNPTSRIDPSGNFDVGDYLENKYQELLGIKDGIVNVATGLSTLHGMVTQPWFHIDEWKAMGYAATHPGETWDAIYADYSGRMGTTRGRASIATEIVLDVLLAKGLGNVATGARAATTGAKAASTMQKAATFTPDEVALKGASFFKRFANQKPFEYGIKRLGDYTEFSLKVHGHDPRKYTRWVKVVNPQGKTVRYYHDSFDEIGRFSNRSIKRPGPQRHIYWNGEVKYP